MGLTFIQILAGGPLLAQQHHHVVVFQIRGHNIRFAVAIQIAQPTRIPGITNDWQLSLIRFFRPLLDQLLDATAHTAVFFSFKNAFENWLRESSILPNLARGILAHFR